MVQTALPVLAPVFGLTDGPSLDYDIQTTPDFGDRVKKFATRAVGLAVACLLLAAGLIIPASSAAASPPGPAAVRAANPQPKLRVPVNVVLVGFDKEAVGPNLLAQLAPSGEPVVRFPLNYGIVQPVGIHYDYDYRLVETSEAMTNRFFAHQRKTGRNQKATTYQATYNAQANNRIDVTGPVLYNDARSTQQWLDSNVAKPLGINLQRSYTVYLINWWGRPDFRFHNYRVAAAVDSDTRIDWANDTNPYPYIPTTHWDQAALSGWGGTTSRSWFYDLSAGPDFLSQNWDVDHADLNGDGYFDYRIPPVWEYADDGFLPADYLAADLGAIVRYVAVNLLFTTSPIYDPMAYQPAAHQSLRVHTTIFEGNPAINGDALTDTPAVAANLRTIEPWLKVRSSNKVVTPTPAPLSSAVQSFLYNTPQPSGCWEDYGVPAAQLICTLQEQESTYLPQVGNDTLIPSYTFTGTQDELGQWDSDFAIQGIAMDNLVDGGPAATYQFLWPLILDYGSGNTFTTSHEVGHELGMSHPHDGYDPTCGCPYVATYGTYFTWIGDQSETLMSYSHMSSRRFSVFDKDNLARDVYAGYLANTELPGHQTQAQRILLAKARVAFDSWQFQTAATLARQAWERGAATMTAGSAATSRTSLTGEVPAQPELGSDDPQRVDLDQVGAGQPPSRPPRPGATIAGSPARAPGT